MHYIKSLILLLVIGAPLLTCTPNCENIAGVYFDDYPYMEEGQILIKASNLNALQNKNVFVNDILTVDPKFEPGLGLIVNMPPGVTGTDVKLRIQDVDCADFISTNLSVQPESFFIGNADYISPAPH